VVLDVGEIKFDENEGIVEAAALGCSVQECPGKQMRIPETELDGFPPLVIPDEIHFLADVSAIGRVRGGDGELTA
jgi:hypothetical protein